jgi:hypothetical protein
MILMIRCQAFLTFQVNRPWVAAGNAGSRLPGYRLLCLAGFPVEDYSQNSPIVFNCQQKFLFYCLITVRIDHKKIYQY